MLLNYDSINFGQVEMICELFKDNMFLFGLLSHTEYIYFIDLIKKHGQYSEFLEFYDIILKTSEKRSKSSDIHKIVIQHLLDAKNFLAVNPFSNSNPIIYETRWRRYYSHPPSRELYLGLFMRIMAKCVNKDVGVNLISQTGMLLSISDLLEVLFQESKDLAQKLKNKEHIGKKATEKLRSACDLLKVVCLNSKDVLDQLFKNSTLLT